MIENKVANSGLITLDLEEWIDETPRHYIDLLDQLFQGLILKERDFRTYIKEHNWDQYKNGYVGVYCSTDAIIPTWAYMLVASKLSGIAKEVFFGNNEEVEEILFDRFLNAFDVAPYEGAKLVIKGCGEGFVPIGAYMKLTAKLSPIAQSIMYGEPCSTVPIYKKKMVRK